MGCAVIIQISRCYSASVSMEQRGLQIGPVSKLQIIHKGEKYNHKVSTLGAGHMLNATWVARGRELEEQLLVPI
jgi:hypothetical protein